MTAHDLARSITVRTAWSIGEVEYALSVMPAELVKEFADMGISSALSIASIADFYERFRPKETE